MNPKISVENDFFCQRASMHNVKLLIINSDIIRTKLRISLYVVQFYEKIGQ